MLAKRISFATSRLPAWDDQHKFYGDELLISALEELALDLVFWLEDNGLPFDNLLSRKVKKFAHNIGAECKDVKSIFYKKREDVEALQTYKILCNRNFGSPSTNTIA